VTKGEKLAIHGFSLFAYLTRPIMRRGGVMSTEEERLAKKEREIEKLRLQVDTITQQIYYQLIEAVETDEQIALFERYRQLDKKIDRVEQNHEKKLEALREEREQVFNELNNSLS
jgi:hypothetical protein